MGQEAAGAARAWARDSASDSRRVTCVQLVEGGCQQAHNWARVFGLVPIPCIDSPHTQHLYMRQGTFFLSQPAKGLGTIFIPALLPPVGALPHSVGFSVSIRCVLGVGAAGMDILCSDKTGTLTLNKLSIDTTAASPMAGGRAVVLGDC